MNKIELVGRLVKDPDVRQAGETSVARFTVAVNRRGRAQEGQPTADFPSCVAFGKTADFIGKYFQKGNAIGICGRIQTGSYTNKDGAKVYTTDVICDEVEFVESKGSGSAPAANPSNASGFMNIPDGVEDEGLPFA